MAYSEEPAKQASYKFHIFSFFQHGLRPHGHIFAITLCVIHPYIQDRLRPRGFIDNRHPIRRFDLEGTLATVDQILVTLADEGRWLVFDEEFLQ